MRRNKLVLIGNGMAGVGVIEQILKLNSDLFEITIIGSEPYPNYNRIQLSYVLEGSKTVDDIVLNDWNWYRENGIRLLTGTTVTGIDTDARQVLTDQGEAVAYDKLVIATGSKSFILPIPGADKEGVVGFRDIADCDRMLEAARKKTKAAVIGGGLLGLEAAKGLAKLGMEVTVVHLMNDLMERQLDPAASRMLQDELERQGLHFAMGKQTAEIMGDDHVTGLRFADGTELHTEFVVMAVGIKPNNDVARGEAIEVNRGIVVDDYMRTTAEDVYAVGECCEHRGVCYGLVAPLFEQGQVLAKHLCGVETKPYEGTVLATKLKISGVDVFSAGEFIDKPELTIVKMQDDWRHTYKKVLLRDNRIVGGVLFGDVTQATQLQQWIKAGALMTADMHASIMGLAGEAAVTNAAELLADEDIVCGCNGVTKGQIIEAVRDQGLTTIDEVKGCTGACRSCGGCKPLVEQVMQSVLGDHFTGAAAQGICGCTTHSRDEVVAAIRDHKLMTTRDVMAELGWTNPEGCSKCRPALNYFLTMMWPREYVEEKESRFVNERLHANINKDGTYAVVPRIYGGVTTAEDLKRIADTAVKYGVKTVKITGGQRIDLLGIEKEDLPKVWEELDMPSGYAYAKALRTVKTCVGSAFCRFGTQDSMAMGQLLERKFERIDMPAKVKFAVNGCPRNCAEACTKDIGIVGNDGGWEIYVGGNGGIKPRLADLIAKVKTDEELIDISAAILQHYRETAKYLERTSDWVERIGLAAVAQAAVHDLENRERLVERMEEALTRAADPWQKVIGSPEDKQALFETVKVARTDTAD
ncbi:nitrite reductase large subunit NirB [Paenibacillus sp. FJAT-26967]|uniref:nitrite reductase large subunit NirB n=1 Tax=Paenibacillus sp. FJAT-26967 TaxID=1729690 RepID=UPI000838C7B1|nr:nitrite reductase large subunit NirB [Paenibacillus sp. FJAT-26967]